MTSSNELYRQPKCRLDWNRRLLLVMMAIKRPDIRDGVLEDCPRPRGHLEDKISAALALALASNLSGLGLGLGLECGVLEPI